MTILNQLFWNIANRFNCLSSKASRDKRHKILKIVELSGKTTNGQVFGVIAVLWALRCAHLLHTFRLAMMKPVQSVNWTLKICRHIAPLLPIAPPLRALRHTIMVRGWTAVNYSGLQQAESTQSTSPVRSRSNRSEQIKPLYSPPKVTPFETTWR